MSTDTFQSSLYNDEKAMAHSNGWSDECNADRDEARNVENLRRVRAARREQPWATRITPPDDPRERGGVGRALIAAMRWCDEHRHAGGVLDTTEEAEHANS